MPTCRLSSTDGLERGIQTKQTQFAVCVPSRKEAVRREQARRNMECRKGLFRRSGGGSILSLNKMDEKSA